MENNQTKLPDYTEYDTAVNQVIKPNTNLNTEQEIEELSRHDNNFELEEEIIGTIKPKDLVDILDASDITFANKRLENFNVTIKYPNKKFPDKIYTVKGYKLNIKNQPNTNLIATQYGLGETKSIRIKGWQVLDIKKGVKIPLDQTFNGNAGVKSEISYLLSYTINKRSIPKDSRLNLESIGFDFSEKRVSDTGSKIRAKKKVTADASYNNDHLGGEVPALTREDWALDKGIDLRKYPKNSDAFKQITKRYTTYKNHLEKVRQFEYNLTEKPLSKYSLATFISVFGFKEIPTFLFNDLIKSFVKSSEDIFFLLNLNFIYTLVKMKKLLTLSTYIQTLFYYQYIYTLLQYFDILVLQSQLI